MLTKKVDILNFNDLYLYKNFFEGRDYKFINLRHVENNTYYCEKSTLDYIEDQLEEKSKAHIRFMGSGNYHYITYLYLKRIEEPFSLILFDNHTEMLETFLNPYISCGSWILHSFKKLDKLKNVVMIGTKKDYYSIIPKDYKYKTKLVDIKNYGSRESMIMDIGDFLASDNIYISIDKDVLRTKDALTNWDHGSMSLEELLSILEGLLSIGRVLGVDICGEYSFKPYEEYRYEFKKALKLNNKANGLILNTILKTD